jgi:hypothetical protein
MPFPDGEIPVVPGDVFQPTIKNQTSLSFQTDIPEEFLYTPILKQPRVFNYRKYMLRSLLYRVQRGKNEKLAKGYIF